MAESKPAPVLDVRDEVAFAAGHAAGAVNIPAQEIAQRTHELPLKGATIRLFDADSDRLAIVACMLRTRGYEVEEVPLTAGDLTETGPSSQRLWRPSPFLVEALDWIGSHAAAAPPRALPVRALDVACGAGREAVYLATRGYQVDAIDVLPDALQRAGDLARRNGVAIHTIGQDLRRQPLLENQAFDLVAVFRFLHRPLLSAVGRSVAPGGHIVYETFHWRDAGQRGPLSPGRALQDGELAAAFEGFEPIIVRDGVERDGRCFSQLLARRRD
jgi:SAM-dependent methyltransferase